MGGRGSLSKKYLIGVERRSTVNRCYADLHCGKGGDKPIGRLEAFTEFSSMVGVELG